jgi:predicted GIY-YIG superfamily endonuclease
MRRDLAVNIDSALEELWKRAAKSIPDWLPMRDIEWLPLVYEVCARFQANSSGRTNVYLVLLDYSDSRADPHALYVGMSRYSAHQRFDQHKAGIRAAGSVLRRGLEVLTGPTAHLRNIARNEAVRIEAELAEALRQEGLFVQGGH